MITSWIFTNPEVIIFVIFPQKKQFRLKNKNWNFSEFNLIISIFYAGDIILKMQKTHSMDLEDSVQLQNLDDLLDDINDLN